ncbi:tRNA (adenine(22)-N(1))-methyltransferase [Bacillus sp. ZZV12-4809]|nr:tRNA (adenine(22)-N(1))-methyltransferase [Bacillus sp. ZZV12-4809]
MNTEKLSKRLESVANYIPKGARLADIGSDHAYLPCYAVKKGIVPFAVAGEVVEGPYQSAKKQVRQEGLENQISVRKGNGLVVIEQNEVDCVTIAGMGGALIASILEEGKDKLASVKRLILQPNLSAISIRSWLIENGWELIAEEILEEDGKIYEILGAEKGEPLKPYKNKEQGLLMGPFLMEQKSAAFQNKWLSEMKNWERILHQLEKAAYSSETEERKQELKQKIKMAEEVLML